MCGFLGIQRLDGATPERALVEAMRDQMLHRGPDDAGLRIDGSVALAHRRLSIVDLSPLGHQPMSNEDGTVWLTFNGEVYNYVELVPELEARGHRFRSHTDSEVIIHLWEEMGPRCVERLSGMFAFVIWDANRQELFGARDRAGIKPFNYFHRPGDRFIAASEIKAILEDPAVPRRPDAEGISDFLFSGFPMGERTCFAGVRQLPPGHALLLSRGELRTWEYWDLTYRYDRQRSLDDTLGTLGGLLDDAVRIHCRSDAPLGCHLSGGLDSSTVVALTRRHHDPLDTFGIRFEGGAFFDESRYARMVSAHVGTTHWEDAPGHEDLAGLLASLAWHSDVPMPGHTIFAYYAASRLASSHVKVSLTGHGGDEILAGYPAQFQAAFGDTTMFDLSGRPVPARAGLSGAARLRQAIRRHGLVGAARRALGFGAGRSFAADPFEEQWMRAHVGVAPLEDPMLRPEFRRTLAGYDSREPYLAPLRAAKTDEALDRCLYHDLRAYLPGLLHQEDRASMAVSLESRVPLLDKDLVEFLATVPPEQKVVGRVPKALLRRIAEPLLPAEVVARRDKGAFGVPTKLWFEGPLGPFLRDLVHSDRARERGIIDARALDAPGTSALTLWSAMSLELWFRIFIDRDPALLERVAVASAARSAKRV